MSDKERLQKYMAGCGVGSRRACEEIITSGRVKVNGKTVTELGTKVDADNDTVSVDGSIIRPEKRFVYIVLNKPTEVLTSMSDPFGREVVVDLIPDLPERVYPVGRLDMDSEGLLILTNDGDLAYRLMHPKYHVKKTYLVGIQGNLSPSDRTCLTNGVMLDDGMTFPADVVQYDSTKDIANDDFGDRNSYLITISEGRNRQVRRMFEAVGCRVLRLLRIKYGPIKLGDLGSGCFRHLRQNEINLLKSAVGLDIDKR